MSQAPNRTEPKVVRDINEQDLNSECLEVPKILRTLNNYLKILKRVGEELKEAQVAKFGIKMKEENKGPFIKASFLLHKRSKAPQRSNC